jgi:hypothetical protein
MEGPKVRLEDGMSQFKICVGLLGNIIRYLLVSI